MIDASFVQLDRQEEVLGIVRRSLLSKWWRWLFATVWLLLPFFFFYPLIKIGLTGLIVFLVLIVSAVWNAWRRWREWYYTMFLITDRRIIDIDQRGLFHREVEELAFKDVSEVKVEQSTFQKLGGTGSIRVHTIQAQKFDLELAGVRHPEHVRDLIVDVQYTVGDYVDQAKSKQ